MVQFLRRQSPWQALIAAALVPYVVRYVWGSQASFQDEIRLIRDVAGEMYRLGQRPPGRDEPREGEKARLQRGTKRLSGEDPMQWEQHFHEAEAENEAAADALFYQREEQPYEEAHEAPPSGTDISHTDIECWRHTRRTS